MMDSVSLDEFKSRFLEMGGILGVVSLISYGIGVALRGALGVEI
jgi:hypothetical protein